MSHSEEELTLDELVHVLAAIRVMLPILQNRGDLRQRMLLQTAEGRLLSRLDRLAKTATQQMEHYGEQIDYLLDKMSGFDKRLTELEAQPLPSAAPAAPPTDDALRIIGDLSAQLRKMMQGYRNLAEFSIVPMAYRRSTQEYADEAEKLLYHVGKWRSEAKRSGKTEPQRNGVNATNSTPGAHPKEAR